ncbi:Uncharacterised protein [Salmonella enterica subsp. arizonae]|uniref:Uncharacterized protein n=2 Tax=Salmonella enterica TaxID=28901 RepID=A0A3S4K8Q0_SALER|nr:Uncharacterised protein [Salmonella enterica subsp. diarizonae]SUG58112.1 Uncharacterised protein [Salmonella enterica subsp. diarizonae]SUG63310.1 Uncharacterised protein [Salmonella enterica subsp. arizonae]VEA79661.1 Uncharacterised protein [Salmonella enterica subsp. arizonae]VFS83953.1 Uncharacterised protein [Salmonella enterica subsp. diarizonae]
MSGNMSGGSDNMPLSYFSILRSVTHYTALYNPDEFFHVRVTMGSM